jgi:hypothetical protein
MYDPAELVTYRRGRFVATASGRLTIMQPTTHHWRRYPPFQRVITEPSIVTVRRIDPDTTKGYAHVS